MFWKKPKPKPWYRKLWDEWRQLFVSLGTIATILGTAYNYVAVDVTPFVDTTEIVAVADQRNLYVQIDTITELTEQAFIVVNLDGQQVASRVYPKGIPEGSIIMDIPIPFTSEGNYLDVNIEIVVVGPRTLFIPETLEVSVDVEKQGAADAKAVYRIHT